MIRFSPYLKRTSPYIFVVPKSQEFLRFKYELLQLHHVLAKVCYEFVTEQYAHNELHNG